MFPDLTSGWGNSTVTAQAVPPVREYMYGKPTSCAAMAPILQRLTEDLAGQPRARGGCAGALDATLVEDCLVPSLQACWHLVSVAPCPFLGLAHEMSSCRAGDASCGIATTACSDADCGHQP